ncbi:Hypothetical predicted protein [Pelobates cultripes]|uniref:Uncharacterized protein n=1 Tax=Pelobates cultripes TaxID=61616 RepID=A0AAD1RWX9_PELCU|nr:Hypothetical predicted protein [Pelobates cultripes]
MYDDPDTEGDNVWTPSDTSTAIRRHTQKLQSGSSTEQPDIRVLLQRQATPKMATAKALTAPMRPSPQVHSLAQQAEGEHDTMLSAIRVTRDNTLATKQDFQQWMQELQKMLHADIGTRKTDVCQTTE